MPKQPYFAQKNKAYRLLDRLYLIYSILVILLPGYHLRPLPRCCVAVQGVAPWLGCV
nr:MAG TPA: hypothetical protein [Caudoviricetes sp.]